MLLDTVDSPVFSLRPTALSSCDSSLGRIAVNTVYRIFCEFPPVPLDEPGLVRAGCLHPAGRRLYDLALLLWSVLVPATLDCLLRPPSLTAVCQLLSRAVLGTPWHKRTSEGV